MTIAIILQGHDAEIISCSCEETVRTAISKLAGKRIGALPVLAGGKVVGIFSERDVIYTLESQGEAALDRPVETVMTAPAVTVTPQTGILSALSLMTKRRIRHLPVVDGDQLVGFVSIGDLVKHRIEKIEAEANAMRDYIQQV